MSDPLSVAVFATGVAALLAAVLAGRRARRRAAGLAAREAALAAREAVSSARETSAAAALSEADGALAEARARVAASSGLSAEEARRRLLADLEEGLAGERARRVAEATSAATAEAEARAREVVVTAIQRVAASHTAEKATSTVEVPDDRKGRVVGREGRNVRAFERATGCDLVVDAAPGVVTVSAFDPVRREVARRALEALVADGRIDPSRIEEVVRREAEATEARLLAAGRGALVECGVQGVHAEVERLLGRLEVRTSFGQNVLRHSVEVAHLAGALAAEVGLDEALARRAGLLHDLGKALDADVPGGHGPAGAAVARRCGEPEAVVNAIESHHEDAPQGSLYAVLVLAADAISAGRPGARRESEDRHGRRLRDLERIALGFPGVEAAFAIRAGRELRVVVDASRVADGGAPLLARDIARAVEEGDPHRMPVRVSVLRETRATHQAG